MLTKKLILTAPLIATAVAAIAASSDGGPASAAPAPTEQRFLARLQAHGTVSGIRQSADEAAISSRQATFLRRATAQLGDEPPTAFAHGPSDDFAIARSTQTACVVTADGGGTCGPLDSARSGGVYLLEFDRPPAVKPGQNPVDVLPRQGQPYPATIRGIAPDGIDRVEGTTTDGDTVTAEVTGNAYELHGTFTKVRLVSTAEDSALDLDQRWFPG